ncbi:MAG: diaminopimelate dehydrogenase [Clostridiaceae bacterium]|nr:diaminopimelate dehydrogenase [Clostridiaceae bacterium]
MVNIGIVGFGNLGASIEKCLENFPDINLITVFTRRKPDSINSKVKVDKFENIDQYETEIDVLILAGGSQKDIPEQGPQLIRNFNTVDVFDNHAEVKQYYTKMNKIALENNKVAVVSTGWDPGLFSLERTLADAILPKGNTHTFWGPGLSQGHSDVVRRVPGVKYGAQYTIPNKKMLDEARQGKKIEYSTATAHQRDVYVVLEETADSEEVSDTIKNIPDYFAPYQTNVYIISEEEFFANHQGMPHGGTVIRLGETSQQVKANFEFNLNLSSNPEFTASVSLAYARAAARLAAEKNYGAKTVLDIPISYLSSRTKSELLAKYI